MVRLDEVVVHGLGDADDAQLIVLARGEVGQPVGGVGGIVPADVEEVADAVRAEDGEQPPIVG
ncbi:MAG TPA: hypothetical protein VJ206_08110, partial [bacterium]|nr:hypothetical protein [bacterium]